MLTFKYDAPINEFLVVPAGTKVKIITDWNEYKGFVAVEYKGNQFYFNEQYFVETRVKEKAYY